MTWRFGLRSCNFQTIWPWAYMLPTVPHGGVPGMGMFPGFPSLPTLHFAQWCGLVGANKHKPQSHHLLADDFDQIS